MTTKVHILYKCNFCSGSGIDHVQPDQVCPRCFGDGKISLAVDMAPFPPTVRDLQHRAHATALEKGWYKDGPRQVPELLCLMHSEISEALEEFRNGMDPQQIYFTSVNTNLTNEQNPLPGKPEGIPIELADLVIRVLDFCGAHKIDLENAILLKMLYNSTRPYRHGGKKV